jgi:phage gp16-like protein
MAEDGQKGTDFESITTYEEELAAIEEETEQKVSQTLSSIEEAVEAWKAAGKKPPELKDTITQLQRFYDDLVQWEKRTLRGKKTEDLETRINRLSEFAKLCAKYEKEGMERAG